MSGSINHEACAAMRRAPLSLQFNFFLRARVYVFLTSSSAASCNTQRSPSACR